MTRKVKIIFDKAEADRIGLRLAKETDVDYGGYQPALRLEDRELGGWMYFTDRVTGTSFCVGKDLDFEDRLAEVRRRFEGSLLCQ